MKIKFTKVFFTLLLCLIFNQLTFSQASKIWDKSLGGSDSDILITNVATKDNGFLLGGTSTSGVSGTKSTGNKGLQDYWIVKTNGDGNKEWDKTYGGSGSDYLQTAWQTADGGYILGGSSNSPVSGDRSFTASGQYDYWIIKLDADGNKQWDKSYGGSGNDYLKAVVQTRDGGYILGGTSDSPVSGKTGYNKTAGSKGLQDYWIIKIDAAGTKQWDKTFGGSNYDYLQTIQLTNDNGYVFGGHSYSAANGDKSESSNGFADFWLVKVDANGNKQWDKTYGGNLEENLESCLLTPDGGYLLGGISNSPSSNDKSEGSNGLSDYWLIKIDGAGNKKWDKTFGGNNNDYLQAIIQTYDNGFLLGGTSDSPVSGDKSTDSKGESDFWIVKVNANGDKQWNRTYGGEGYDNLQALQVTSTGGCLLTGTSNSNASGDKNSSSRGDTDYWFINLDLGGPDNPPPTNPEIESFTLLNADTDTDIQTLTNGATIDLAALTTKNLNIRANTNTSTISSVAFNLSGAQDLIRTESGAPYTVFGSTGNDYNAWVPATGNYTLKATPSVDAQVGTPLTINFKVVDESSTGNQAPLAFAGENSTIYLPTSSTTLNGSGSDADGSVNSYLWVQNSGPNTATFSSKTIAKPTVSSLVAGTYVFSLTVKDNDNAASNPAQVTVTVTNSNSQQVVSYTLMNADTDTEIQTIENGAILNLTSFPTKNLNIRVNTNPEIVGSVVMVLGGRGSLTKTETAAPYAVFGDVKGDYGPWIPAVGDYTLKTTPYTQAGGGGSAGTALSINFQVINQSTGNQKPIASAGSNFTISLPTTSTTLNGSGSDADGSIESYLWVQSTGPTTAIFSSKTVAKPTISNLVAGTYVFSLTVKDNNNASSNPAQVTITVNNSDSPDQQILSFTLLNADADTDIQTINNGATLNLSSLPTKRLNVRVNTSTNSIGVAFALKGAETLNRSEATAPYIVFGASGTDYSAWTPTVGNYTLEATPYSKTTGNTVGTSLVINFKVVDESTGNQAPLAFAGENSTIYLPTSSTTLNGSGSDADGSVNSYLWVQNSGPNTATFSSKTIAKPTVSSLVAGTYVFSLTVKDNDNAASSPAQVTITVSNSSPAGQKVVSYTLMNADTNKEIQTIANGGVLNLAALPTKNLNIRVNTNPEIVGSVIMVLGGRGSLTKTETAAPYAVFGDVSGDYSAWVPPIGDYTLKTTPYTLAKGAGTAGTPLTINFKIVNVAGGSPVEINYVPGTDSLAVEESAEDPYSGEAPATEEVRLTNFPNPFQNQTTFQFSFPEEQEYTLEIYDLNGTLVNRLKTDTAPAGELIEVTWQSDHLNNGIYVVRLITDHEVQHLQIIKED
ncbi:hypothetical protein AHMF7605_09010 [Adhaeribacter arboris]|uniref:PKD/Chitinase domain-containing protein n=1 Tax=Adhaeribacter arboris TaxID=2072846 RepID=A0A2T2YDT8_9BACT|nr:T9SS type A sorting domain-containing protein [Adhaeribacter arboris]PSR53653.1 hypothetical protein AHMF7605_09010 [Adhaeribacter arboris]